MSSSMENVKCGVQQGSTLKSLLFFLYMINLPLATKFKVNLFADDTNLTMKGNNVKQLESDINNELINKDSRPCYAGQKSA